MNVAWLARRREVLMAPGEVEKSWRRRERDE
jgi:hypothetical protein